MPGIYSGRARPWLLSIASGLLLALSFPRFSLDFLAWVAVAPLLLALDRAARPRQAVLRGYLSGLVFFAATHGWVRIAMVEYGGLGTLTAVGVHLAFAALLAVYLGLFGGLAWLLLRHIPAKHILWGLPALWVGVELLRSHALTGLPFLLLGYALAGHLLLAQLARFGGVYLLSFVLALFNTGILLLLRNPTRRGGMALAAAFLALALLAAGGVLLPEPRATEPVYLVQTNMSMHENWSGEPLERLLSELSSEVIATWARNDSRPGLVVWPEIPASLYYEQDLGLRFQLGRLARSTQSRMLVNVIAFDDSAQQLPFNSVVLIGTEGGSLGRYDKIHLVPFGEYVPYRPVFFFAGTLTSEVGGFVAGSSVKPLGPQRPVGPLICYEGIFPDLVRRFTAEGASVLVNVSNDGWYGTSAARDQLLLMARLRAVENGRWLLRATNTGLTAVIDPYGRVTQFPADRRGVYTAAFGYGEGQTVYVAFGHWFAAIAAGGAGILLAGAIRAERRARRPVRGAEVLPPSDARTGAPG